MADLKKVIYGIERCICRVPDACRDCGYDAKPYPACEYALMRDALELLKAKEPVKPRNDDAWPYPIAVCGACKAVLFKVADYKPKYCSECGRAIRWEKEGQHENR